MTSVRGVAALVALGCVAATGAQAAREPVLKQVDVPHNYYWRELYLPQLTTGPSAADFLPGGRELVYTGRMIDAAEAHRIGLADRVVPDEELDSAAFAWASELAAGPTAALAVAKRVTGAGLDLPLGDALALEAAGFRECFSTADAVEGVTAFLEKRSPKFRGS